MDLDTTVRGFALTHESAERAFREIMAVQADDDWEFEFDRTEDVRVAETIRASACTSGQTTRPCPFR